MLQKRRLCVALQLINMPSVLFLDEPTSGLCFFTVYMCFLVELSVTKTICQDIKSRGGTLLDYDILGGRCLLRRAV